MKNCYLTNNIANYSKKAIIFAPNYFRIRNSIVFGLEKNDIGVISLLDKPSDSTYIKSKLRLNPKSIHKIMKRYLKKILRYAKTFCNVPDYIIIFEGQAFLEEHIKYLREEFPNSKLIIYCWDCMNNYPYIEQNLKYFDKKITFSIDDFQNYPFDCFLPLFIPEDFANYSNNELGCKYDLSFIGTGHPPKIDFLNRIENFASENKLNVYESIYLPSRLMYLYYKAKTKPFKNKKMKDFVYTGKGSREIKDIYSQSKAVIDAGDPNESGVSLRIFECLAVRKKVVLANKRISKYSFYHPDRFLVFPDEQERINDFLKSEYPPLSEDEFKDLLVESWIAKIIR